MRVLSIVWKDLRIYVRQRKTLLLMVLCPVLIMLLIGSVFSGAPEGGLKGITLGVAGPDTPLSREIIDSLSGEETFTITHETTPDPEEMRKKVRAGEYSAGIILPVNETDTIKLFLDNSKLQVAPVISTVFIMVTEKLSFEITLEFIERLWTSLQEMEAHMGPLGTEVVRVRDSIIAINADAKDIKDSLDAMDIEGLNTSVKLMNENLADMKGELNQTRSELNTTRKEILDLNSTIGSIDTDATELRDQLGMVVENINSTDAALLDLQKGLESIYQTTCLNQTFDPRCISTAATIDQIDSTRGLLRNRTSSIISLYDNLGRVAQTSEELQFKLAEMDDRLRKIDGLMVNYTNRIDDIKGNIAGIEDTTIALKEIRDEATLTFSEVDVLTRQINKSSEELLQNINSTKGMLSEVTARPPTAVAAPVKLDRFKAFEGRSHLDFLMPGIIGIVLMFVCFLLASITITQEKTRGTLLRTMLSPLTLPELLLGKILGLLFIAFFQGVILVVIAFFLYGISLTPEQLLPLFGAIFVYSASFIAIGMVIASFADSENTAMLSSMVLSIPMLFLCGVFYPFEMMPGTMAAFGNLLPITMGIEVFKDILVYQRAVMLEDLSGLVAYFVLALVIASLQMRKELVR